MHYAMINTVVHTFASSSGMQKRSATVDIDIERWEDLHGHRPKQVETIGAPDRRPSNGKQLRIAALGGKQPAPQDTPYTTSSTAYKYSFCKRDCHSRVGM